MVHTQPSPPWRRRAQRVVGFLLAGLGVVVLVIAIIALRQPNGRQAALHSDSGSSGASSSAASIVTHPSTSSTAPKPASSTPATHSSAATTHSVKSIALIVLNSTNEGGLAESAAGQFRAGGWTVTSTGNLVNNIISTCAYYDPNVPGAQAAATALQAQFPAIKRVEPKFTPMPAGPVIVVLTSDWPTT